MSYLYEFGGLDAVPNQGYVEVETERAGFPAIENISFHPSERWLKIWFATELSEALQTSLEGIVATAQTKGPRFKRTSGYSYQELYANSNGWTEHRVCVQFGFRFAEIPKVAISNSEMSNATDIQVIDVREDHFMISMRAKGRSGISVGFNWEAWG